MEMFPLIFGRVGGYPLEIFDSLKSKIADTYVKRFIDSYQQVNAQRAALLEKLYVEINHEPDEKRRNALLNFKRDLFNKRPRAENVFRTLTLNKRIESEIKEFFQKKADHENLVSEFKSVFCSEEAANIATLNRVTSSFFFRNGLIFSSHVLFHELNKRSLAGADKSVVISLLKYLTRSVTKTTPFSSFNSLFFLHKETDKFTSDEIVKSSSIQLSNLVYHHIRSFLLDNDSFTGTLPIRCNSTLWIEDGPPKTFHFFQNDNNNESFKKLLCSSALLTIKNLVDANDITHRELIMKLHHLSGEDKKSIEEYTSILIKEGFLKIIFPASCTDKNWVSELNAFLRKNQLTEELGKLENLLSTATRSIESLENCFDAESRYEIILNYYDLLIEFFNSCDPSNEFSKKVSAQELFYEDHFTRVNDSISGVVLQELLSEVKKAFSVLNNIKTKRVKRSGMMLALENNEKMPLLQFYEKIYLPNHQDYSFLNEEIKMAENVAITLINRIEKSPGHNSIDISDLAEPDEKIKLNIPFGVYLQTEDDEFRHVVINSFSHGYGANISRFLNPLPEKYSQELMRYNESLFPDTFIVEIKDASIHNVGTYPKVTGALIDLCDNRSFSESHTIISLADVFVAVNEFKHLILVDGHGRNLQVLNFSMEGLNRRSAFYRFIDLFNDTDLSGLNYILSSIEQFYVNKALQTQIVFIPRIIFGKRLVIQRRKWLIPKTTLLSLSDRTKENAENFLNVTSFMIENGIPDEVFIRFAKRNYKNLQDDKYKPQYFSFKIPVFTALFIDQLSKAGDIIEISEMFPASDSVMNTGGKVKEYILNCC